MKASGIFLDYKKLTLLCCLFLIVVSTTTSCKKNNPSPMTPSVATNGGGTSVVKTQQNCSTVYTLFAGQTINIGTLTVSNDADSIYVTYATQNGWVLNETHLYVGAPGGIPVNNAGNPTVGLFPYNATHNGITTYTVAVPINPALSCYAIAAHASVSLLGPNNTVIQSETAWSNGQPINQTGNWATYSTYCLLDCGGCTYQTVHYNYFAGQNILVGTLDVTNDAQNLYVTYHFTGSWYAGATHLYVGSAAGLPVNGQNVPVPGHFPYSTIHNPMVQSYTYTIPLASLDPCYIIAAHADVYRLNSSGTVVQTETGWSFGTHFPGTNRWGWYSNYCTQVCP